MLKVLTQRVKFGWLIRVQNLRRPNHKLNFLLRLKNPAIEFARRGILFKHLRIQLFTNNFRSKFFEVAELDVTVLVNFRHLLWVKQIWKALVLNFVNFVVEEASVKFFVVVRFVPQKETSVKLFLSIRILFKGIKATNE